MLFKDFKKLIETEEYVSVHITHYDTMFDEPLTVYHQNLRKFSALKLTNYWDNCEVDSLNLNEHVLKLSKRT